MVLGRFFQVSVRIAYRLHDFLSQKEEEAEKREINEKMASRCKNAGLFILHA